MSQPPAGDGAAAALLAAVDAARSAPSVHNTQPWHWQIGGDTLRLRAERERQLAIADPDGLLLAVSCGAALYQVQLALAAAGWRAAVRLVPDPADPDLLATLTASRAAGPDPAAAALLAVAPRRHTDRRPVSDAAPDPAALDAVAAAVTGQGVHLYQVRREEMVELAVAMSRADEAEAGEPAHRAELARWVGGTRTDGLGIPAAAIPERPARTQVQGRYLGEPGTLPIDEGHDAQARYVVLHGETDGTEAWLRAGQALGAGWLTATARGLSVLPISAVVEVTSTRLRLRRLLAAIGYPYLALRLGVPQPGAPAAAATPRLPVEAIVEVAG